MHHQLSAGGNQRRAAGVMHYSRGTEVLMHHIGMAVGRYQRHGSDALLLRDALLMHHVGMAAGSRPGDASSVGGRREPAACGGSDALFSWDRGPDASRMNGGCRESSCAG
jgi:hypothetical protein